MAGFAISRAFLLGLVSIVLAAAGVLVVERSRAFEIPPPGDPLHIQTNGPNGAMSLGDWYTTDDAGGGSGYHYLSFFVTCSWPAGQDIQVDLFGPEMNGDAVAAGISDEINGAELDPTEFELYGPGATVGPGYDQPAPGAGIAGTQTTYNPVPAGSGGEEWERFATLPAPVICGRYVVRAQTKGTEADDQNGWRLRVGLDNDADPNTAPPADYDNPDGLPGSDDELQAGIFQTAYQHEVAGENCQTIHEFVDAGPSVTFHNFDFDNNGRVRYYAPSDTYDPQGLTGGTAGTTSGQTVWNNGSTSRGGDVISNPEPGWWKIVSCISPNNQYIQEGQDGELALTQDPVQPVIDVDKDDGITQIVRGDNATYTIDITNTSSGATAGAAKFVQVDDDLPDGFTPTGCQWVAPATGTCNIVGQQVTANLNGILASGESASLEIDYSVDNDATGTLVNTALVGFEDSFGNVFPPESATDSDQTLIENADLVIDKSHTGDFIYGEQGTYDLEVTNNGPNTAVDVQITDVLPAGLSFAGFSGAGWNCTEAGGTVTCDRAADLGNGVSDSVQITVDVGAAALGGVTNPASVSALTDDPDPANNDDTDPTNVIAATVSGTVFEDEDVSSTIDPGEVGIGGWIAYVDLDDNGSRDPTEPFDTTDGNGDYTITDIISGTHRIRIEPQAGWTCSFPTPCNYSRDLSGAANATGLDFAVWEAATISGTVHDDEDSDGILGEPGEGTLSGWTVYLDLDDSGSPDPGEPTDTTDGTGGYSFTGLTPGTFRVRVDPVSGWTCSAPVPCTYSLVLTSGDDPAGNDFGFWNPASLGGTLYEDVDGDGNAGEAGEGPLSGWTVYLDLDDSGTLDPGEPTDVTDATGDYSFAGLVPRDYTIRLEVQPSWTCSSPAACSYDVTLSAGDLLFGNDFAVWAPANLAGILFKDLDRDGAPREPNEPALAGWTVYLDTDSSGTRDAGEMGVTTDAAGAFSIAGLAPAPYRVRVVLQGSFTCTHPSPCARDLTLVSGQSATAQDFGANEPSTSSNVPPIGRQVGTIKGGGDGGGNEGSSGSGTLPFTGFILLGLGLTGAGLLMLGRTIRPRQRY